MRTLKISVINSVPMITLIITCPSMFPWMQIPIWSSNSHFCRITSPLRRNLIAIIIIKTHSFLLQSSSCISQNNTSLRLRRRYRLSLNSWHVQNQRAFLLLKFLFSFLKLCFILWHIDFFDFILAQNCPYKFRVLD